MFKYDCNTKRKKPVKVRGKVIGYLDGNRFIKMVKGSRHRLRRPPAWAIDAEVFNSEIRPNATDIIIRDKESGLEYHASVDTFDRLRGELNRGFGRQYFLTLNHWQERGNGHQQLSLWGGGEIG